MEAEEDLWGDGTLVRRLLRKGVVGGAPLARGDRVLLDFSLRSSCGRPLAPPRRGLRCTLGGEATGCLPRGCARRALEGLHHGSRVSLRICAGRFLHEPMHEPPWILHGFEFVDDALEWDLEVWRDGAELGDDCAALGSGADPLQQPERWPREPWDPRHFAHEELRAFQAAVRALAAELRGEPGQRLVREEGARSSFRMISLARADPQHPVAAERRTLMERECMRPLLAAGLGAEFFEGCLGAALPLDVPLLVRGGRQEACWRGEAYEVDTSLYVGRDGHVELREMERRFHQKDFFPLFWHALRKNHQEPQTPGFVGGHISHAEVWKEALRSDLDWVFVAEDDCLPCPSVAEGRRPLTWLDVWLITAAQVRELRAGNVAWDILYVGRSPSQSRPGPALRRPTGAGPPLLEAPGWCMRTQSYCLSREGLRKLCASELSRSVLHRPQDELLAALAMGGHPQEALWRRLLRGGPRDWRALAFRFDGITCQLQDLEKSQRALSFCACSDGISGVPKEMALNPGLLES